jgi:hypothetical protein
VPAQHARVRAPHKQERIVSSAANPYSRRSAIRSAHEFFGRHLEMKEIYELLNLRQSIFLRGERRTGKSSILNAITFLREADEFVSLVPPNLRVLSLNCLYAENSPERRFIKHFLSQAAAEFPGEDLPPERDSLLVIGERARRADCLLAVLMDEFDVLMQNPHIGSDLFSFLRAWSEEYQFPFVISSREGAIEPLLKTHDVGSPFWNIFKVIYVGPFPHDEALVMIQTPAYRAARPFGADEVAWIHERGGHLPFFLQIAAYYAFAHPGGGAETLAEREAKFVSETDAHFEYLIDFLPERERQALLEFAVGKKVDTRVEPGLLQKGVLLAEDGRTRIFSSALESKLRARAQSGDVKSAGTLLSRVVKEVIGG